MLLPLCTCSPFKFVDVRVLAAMATYVSSLFENCVITSVYLFSFQVCGCPVLLDGYG